VSDGSHPPPPPARWTQRIFAASWLSYFSYYFTRKNLSLAKNALARPLGLSMADLRNIDTAFYGSYAVGQIVNGATADVIGPRRLVTFGMMVSACATCAFAFVDVAFGPVLALYYLLAAINGLVQSSGWPGNGKLMASWFSTRRRGEIMGYWSTCYQAGGLAIGFLGGLLVGWGWRVVFVVPAIYVAAMSVGYWVAVRDRPSDVGYADPDVGGGIDPAERRRLRRASWRQVLRNPLTWALCGSYFCLKLMRYAFLAWLPLYLAQGMHYGDAKADIVSTAFEAGGIPFVIISGVLADRAFGRRRIATAAGCLLLLVGALALYREIGGSGTAQTVLGLALIGAFLFGADALVSGAAAQDLGGPHAAALACGLIDGLGSIGSVVQGYLVVYVEQHHGWPALFGVFEVFALAGALCILPFFRVRPTIDAGAPA